MLFICFLITCRAVEISLILFIYLDALCAGFSKKKKKMFFWRNTFLLFFFRRRGGASSRVLGSVCGPILTPSGARAPGASPGQSGGRFLLPSAHSSPSHGPVGLGACRCLDRGPCLCTPPCRRRLARGKEAGPAHPRVRLQLPSLPAQS